MKGLRRAHGLRMLLPGDVCGRVHEQQPQKQDQVSERLLVSRESRSNPLMMGHDDESRDAWKPGALAEYRYRYGKLHPWI